MDYEKHLNTLEGPGVVTAEMGLDHFVRAVFQSLLNLVQVQFGIYPRDSNFALDTPGGTHHQNDQITICMSYRQRPHKAR